MLACSNVRDLNTGPTVYLSLAALLEAKLPHLPTSHWVDHSKVQQRPGHCGGGAGGGDAAVMAHLPLNNSLCFSSSLSVACSHCSLSQTMTLLSHLLTSGRHFSQLHMYKQFT